MPVKACVMYRLLCILYSMCDHMKTTLQFCTCIHQLSPSPCTVAQPPVNVSAEALNSTAVHITWALASMFEDTTSLSYVVSVTGVNSSNIVNRDFFGTQTQTVNMMFVVVNGLVPFSTYAVSVVIIRAIGESKPSEAVFVRTLEDGKPSSRTAQICS